MTTPQTDRALIVLRLSHSTDESTSVMRQREACEAFCVSQGWPVAAVVEDIDVSGAVSPFERPDFGRYLTDRPPVPYTVVVAWKLDRITRSARDAHVLLDWLRERGKAIATVADSINTRSPYAGVIFAVMAAIAEAERTAIQERLLDSRRKLRELGRHGAGTPTYGYRSVKLPEGGHRWEQHPTHAPIMVEAIERYTSGQSMTEICDDFTERKLPAPRSTAKSTAGHHTEWYVSTLTRLLRSETLIGHGYHKDGKERAVITELGVPVLFTDEPLIDYPTFASLQAVLSLRKIGRRARSQSLLNGIALCAVCRSPLVSSGTEKQAIYLCPKRRNRNPARKCKGGAILRSVADDEALEYFLGRFADVPYGYWETVYPEVGAGDIRAQREQIERALDRLMADRENGLYDTTSLAERFTRRRAEFVAQISEIQQQEHSVDEPRRVWHETGEMWPARLNRVDIDERRKMIRESGISILINPHRPRINPGDRVKIIDNEDITVSDKPPISAGKP